MEADIFWQVIGDYNQQTWVFQIVLMGFVLVSAIFAFKGKACWLLKVSLSLCSIFMGVIFFLVYGQEPIQFFFAAPLFIGIGILFIWDSIRNYHDPFAGFHKFQWLLFVIILLYPLFSLLLGKSFPQMVVLIMPCPLISLSIVFYSGYKTKNKVLLSLLVLWGLTGIKAFFFDAWEDTILLISGIYCIWLLINEHKRPQIVESAIKGIKS